ncbi:hypothetical protein LTR51_000611 [Lithohypha guttulata]|nr:hypothetical protein LTR51_000611 [Lithohypha guttulata]
MKRQEARLEQLRAECNHEEDSLERIQAAVQELWASQPIVRALEQLFQHSEALHLAIEVDASQELISTARAAWRRVVYEGTGLSDFATTHGLEQPETVLESTIAIGVELLREEIDRDGGTASLNSLEEITTTVNHGADGAETMTVELIKRGDDLPVVNYITQVVDETDDDDIPVIVPRPPSWGA